MSAPMEETPPFDPAEHPDNDLTQAPEQPDLDGDPIEVEDGGLDDLLPAVTDDPPIVED